MTPTDFLNEELSQIAREFPGVHIKYGYNGLIRTHVVVLLPLEEFRNNAALDDRWIPLSFQFREKYQDQDIAFVSSDSSLEMKEPEAEWNRPKTGQIDWSSLFATVTETELVYHFPTHLLIDTVFVGSPISDLLRYPTQDLRSDLDPENYYQAAA